MNSQRRDSPENERYPISRRNLFCLHGIVSFWKRIILPLNSIAMKAMEVKYVKQTAGSILLDNCLFENYFAFGHKIDEINARPRRKRFQ